MWRVATRSFLIILQETGLIFQVVQASYLTNMAIQLTGAAVKSTKVSLTFWRKFFMGCCFLEGI